MSKVISRALRVATLSSVAALMVGCAMVYKNPGPEAGAAYLKLGANLSVAVDGKYAKKEGSIFKAATHTYVSPGIHTLKIRVIGIGTVEHGQYRLNEVLLKKTLDHNFERGQRYQVTIQEEEHDVGITALGKEESLGQQNREGSPQ